MNEEDKREIRLFLTKVGIVSVLCLVVIILYFNFSPYENCMKEGKYNGKGCELYNRW
jgi:hypothetical protein